MEPRMGVARGREAARRGATQGRSSVGLRRGVAARGCEGGAGRGQVPEFLLGDHVGGHGLEPGAGEGDLAGDAAPVVCEKGEGCVAEGGGRLVTVVGEGEDEGGGRLEEAVGRGGAGGGPGDGGDGDSPGQ